MSKDAMYLELRQTRRDWTANEAASVAAYYPAIPPVHGGARNPVRDTQADQIIERLGANPRVGESPIDEYPGWTVRVYADGMYDATHRNGALSPGFHSFAEVVEHVRSEERARRAPTAQ